MAAIDEEGTEQAARPASGSYRCSGRNAKGDRCGAWSLKGQEVCLRHSMTDDEWRAMARRGGAERTRKAREKADARDRDRHDVPGPTLQRALEVTHDLLYSTIPDTGEPHFENQAWGVLCVASLFRLRDRAAALELLKQIAPRVAKDPQVHRVLDLEGAKTKLIQAYQEGRISAAELPPGVLRLKVDLEVPALNPASGFEQSYMAG